MATLDSVQEIPGIDAGNTSPTSSCTKVEEREVLTDFGKVKVHIQGDLNEKDKKAVFLTVHDIGTNHGSFRDFVELPCMSEFLSRSIFIHLDLPGQEDHAPDYTAPFPSLQQIGEELLPKVLDELKVPLIVGIGEGAGANILVRFALTNQQRTLGLVLIHLVSAGVGMLEKLKDTFLSGKRRPSEAFQAPEHVIALHRFGKSAISSGDEENLATDYKSRVASINPKNLRRYVEAYMNRKDISEKMSQTRIDCLLIAGGKSPYLQGVVQLHGRMDKTKSSLLKIDNVVDVMSEAPEKLAQSILLFVKGLGYLTSLTLPGVERQRTFSGGSSGSGDCPANKAALGAIGRRRTLSMEEYDLPRPRRLSLSASNANGAPVPGSPTK